MFSILSGATQGNALEFAVTEAKCIRKDLNVV